jgi:hypothetical protein
LRLAPGDSEQIAARRGIRTQVPGLLGGDVSPRRSALRMTTLQESRYVIAASIKVRRGVEPRQRRARSLPDQHLG